MTTSVIPDTYTNYLDGQIGNVAPGLANIVAVVGASKLGTPGLVYAFSGQSAKSDAKLALHSGDLLEAILNEFDNGASEVRAVRAGDPVQGYIDLDNTSAAPALRVKGKLSSLAANDYVTVTRSVAYGNTTLVLTVEDRNTSPYTSYVYTATAADAAVNAALKVVIDAGGVYEAELLDGSAIGLVAASAAAMSHGTDGTPLINADYTAALEATASETDVSAVRASGATTLAQWTLVLTHCATMYEDYAAERYAILEAPLFTTSYSKGTAGYNTDRQTYVDDVVALAASVADKNAVIFCGGASLLDADGTEATRTVADIATGRMMNLRVSQSLVNKTVSGVLELVPEFTPGQMTKLINAKVNFLRRKPGRGYIIGHSLTCCPAGSDYDRVEYIRTVYYAAKQVRAAVEPLGGEAGDAEGTLLRQFEQAALDELDKMKNGTPKEISDRAVSASYVDEVTRRNVKLRMGVQPLTTAELIDHDVYLYS